MKVCICMATSNTTPFANPSGINISLFTRSRLSIYKYSYLTIIQFYKKHIDIEEEQIIYWMKQLLSALECLHSYNILHRYITPESMSFKKDKLKLFMPATSIILSQPDRYVNVENTWYRCPEHVQAQKIGLKYDIWYIY